MGIGVAILLIAIGAILRYAVTAHTNGFNVHTVGVILMWVGALGAVVSLVFWSAMPWRRSTDTVVVDNHHHDEVL